MPGIAGILSKNKSNETPHLLNKMLDSMMHETFYSKSIHTDQEHGWYCGSVAIRGSFSDNMPILNKKRNIVLFFSGELFTDTQVLNQHEVNNSNPVNHVIHLYEDQGPDFVKKLNGWFSGIILDHRRNKAILFNDWYAMCRVYYYEDENAFYFASEAKALLKVLPSLRELDINSVSEYLCFNCVLDNRSFFQGINILPGGSI
jgi:asparagine synthase (glutamine-hydrolysing)